MSDDLVQWLRVQHDADDRIARRAGDSFRQIGETGVIVATEGDRAEECASANWAGVAEHIVTHDPARVLREVDAKRRILEIHHVIGGWEDEDGQDIGLGCNECGYSAEYSDRGGWCDTVRLLALPYADRPGYREEWRP
ncbi:DUF6221 family protein [Streptomyces harbinensis]|uniref:DUF6221 family protein n=1 Tax=Streptomyces harbinensis TaxID=1176198 RepID=UPI0036808489